MTKNKQNLNSKFYFKLKKESKQIIKQKNFKMTKNEMNILIFGDCGVGKRAMQIRFHQGLFLTHQEFQEEYSFSKTVKFNETEMKITSTNIIWSEFRGKKPFRYN